MEELIQLTFVSFDPEEEIYDEEEFTKIWIDATTVHAIVEEGKDRWAEVILKSGISIFIAESASSIVPIVNRLRKRSGEQWWMKN